MIAIEKIDKVNKTHLAAISLITGEDIGQYSQLKEEFLKKIDFNKEDLAYSYFDMSESSYQDVEMDLLSLPFFTDYKIVILDHLLDITTNKKNYLKDNELKAFEAYLENPQESTKLVIFAPGKLDGKRRIAKLLKRDADVLEASLLKERDLRAYFDSYSKKLGLAFDSGVFDKLVLKSNADFSQMLINLNFLKSYRGQGTVTLTDIDEAIPKTLQDNIFDLTRFVLQKDMVMAHDLIHDLILSGEDEIKLIAIMIGQFRLYLQIAILTKEGKNEQQIVMALSDLLGRKINPYQVKYAIKDSTNLSPSFLKYSIKTLIETDYQIKSGQYDKSYLFDLAILKILNF
ncbi:DNA polymerase III subunit delta [Streptococcus didelphis]|uniref:DNA polymerase III subunit delta n=1 Tax=Streptococcus didelphis TaxID=102886 RepID=UPI000364E515|nr:DNA polymerase III subunit delta [Streptococcus didelphis]